MSKRSKQRIINNAGTMAELLKIMSEYFQLPLDAQVRLDVRMNSNPRYTYYSVSLVFGRYPTEQESIPQPTYTVRYCSALRNTPFGWEFRQIITEG